MFLTLFCNFLAALEHIGNDILKTCLGIFGFIEPNRLDDRKTKSKLIPQGPLGVWVPPTRFRQPAPARIRPAARLHLHLHLHVLLHSVK